MRAGQESRPTRVDNKFKSDGKECPSYTIKIEKSCILFLLTFFLSPLYSVL